MSQATLSDAPSVPVLQHPAPNAAWLAQRSEPVIEPDLPIIDPHHHLWDRGGGYYLDELLADTQSGHNIVSTVFLQCAYGYRTDGPEAMRPVGETDFVASVAREAARRGAHTRVCEGIVAFADLCFWVMRWRRCWRRTPQRRRDGCAVFVILRRAMSRSAAALRRHRPRRLWAPPHFDRATSSCSGLGSVTMRGSITRRSTN